MTSLIIYLPKNARLKVKKTDEILFGQKLAEKELPDTIIYDLGRLLSIKPSQIRSVVRKKEGEDVEGGEVLAAKKTLLGTTLVKAIVGGKIARIDEVAGELVVAPQAGQDDVIGSPVAGRVRSIDKEKITVDFDGTVIFAKQGIGRMTKGQLSIVSKAEEDVLLSSVKEDDRQKVLLGGHVSRQVLEKAYAMGIASFLATAIDDGTFPYFEESKLYDASLLLIARADYAILAQYQGKEMVVEGTHKRVIIQG